MSNYAGVEMDEQGMRQGLEGLASAAREAIELLGGDASGGSVDWLEAVRRVEAAERIAHGVKLRLLAEADRRKAARAGVGPWLAAELGYSSGRARALAEEARRIGALPELAGKLAGGLLNQDQTRVLARTVKAADGSGADTAEAVAQTLTVLERDGVSTARARVRVLEETLAPGHVKDLATRQRARSFLRISETEDGMVRVDALLDTQRGTVVRAALDQLTAGWIRSRQYDQIEQLPEDVVTVEQIGAQALTRLAETHLTAPDDRRAEGFKPHTLYFTPAPGLGPLRESAAATAIPDLPQIPPGCAQTVYGDLIPADTLPPMQDCAASLLTLDPATGQPILLDGRALDADPTARLATPDQRVALAFRDRHCTEPGCTRPVTWSLHAHHVTPFKDAGPTTMRNLTLPCPEHHVLRHHPDHGHDLAA